MCSWNTMEKVMFYPDLPSDFFQLHLCIKWDQAGMSSVQLSYSFQKKWRAETVLNLIQAIVFHFLRLSLVSIGEW